MRSHAGRMRPILVRTLEELLFQSVLFIVTPSKVALTSVECRIMDSSFDHALGFVSSLYLH